MTRVASTSTIRPVLECRVLWEIAVLRVFRLSGFAEHGPPRPKPCEHLL